MNRRRALRALCTSAGGLLAGCMRNWSGNSNVTPAPTPCPMPKLDLSESELYQSVSEIEKEIFEKMNESRRSAGVSPVEWDEVLAYVGRLHSRNMGKRNYFSHESKSGLSPSDRISRFGYDCKFEYAENISRVALKNKDSTTSLSEIGNLVVSGWEDSDNHRRAMWSEAAEVAGVGCYINAEHVLYVTCDFCSHDPADAEDAATGTPPEEGCYYGGDPP